MILSEKVLLQFLRYSIFFSVISKFSASNEKMLNGERFIIGYTKRRLFVGE